MKLLFEGSMTALITPFDNGKVDEKALRHLIDWQIAEGTSCLVPCGTTGEAPTLSYEEHERVVSVTVEQVSGRVPVLAGCGSNATENAIKLTKQAKKAGAQGTLQVTPYYNKPTQEGLFQHFEAIAKAVDLPMVLYNVPVTHFLSSLKNIHFTFFVRAESRTTLMTLLDSAPKALHSKNKERDF